MNNATQRNATKRNATQRNGKLILNLVNTFSSLLFKKFKEAVCHS